MIHQHPLAYLLGIEGVALLRAFAGEHDREFVLARFDEVRRLLDSADLLGDGTDIPPITTVEGYRRWAGSYDEPGNGLIDVEEPIVRSIIDELPIGTAVDVACGTGRHTEYLVERGHRVIAVDASSEMLDHARARAPMAEFHEADLHALPLRDSHADVVICALALTHVPDLTAAMRELTRVLRPGGHLVISDAHGLAAGLRPPIVMMGADGEPGYLPHVNRLPGDYVRAALAVGLTIRRCEEPFSGDRSPVSDVGAPIEDLLPAGPPNIWLLHAWAPAATAAAFSNQPSALIWHFQLEV